MIDPAEVERYRLPEAENQGAYRVVITGAVNGLICGQSTAEEWCCPRLR